MQSKVRSMLEGALISGLFIVLMFLTIYTPIGLITAMALSVPFTIYAARHGIKPSLLVIAVSAILTVIIGALPSVFSAIFSGILGVIMGELYRRGRSATVVFIGGTLASLVFFLGSIVVSYYVFKINLITSIQTMMTDSMKLSESMLNQFGASDPKQLEMIKSMINLIPKMIPMIMVVGSATSALINHWLSSKILLRLGTKVSRFPAFRDWSWPKSILYYYLIALAGTLFVSEKSGIGILQVALLNIYPILEIMMVIQGLSLVYLFCFTKGYGKGIPIVATVLVFIFPPFPNILRLLGILDLVLDLRKRILKQ